MNKIVVGIFIGLLILVGGFYAINAYIYNEKQGEQAPGGFYNPWGTTPEEYVLLGTFSGSLPCEDCAGIDLKLTLTQYGQYISEGTYELIERKRGKTETVKALGNWTTNRGTDKDANATVYVLNPDGPEPARYFLRVNESTLNTLDETGNVLPESETSTLLKQ